MTPRPQDMSGLSAFTTPALAAPRGGKVQVIDTERLRNLNAVVDSAEGHVSVFPEDMCLMEEWIESRPKANEDPHFLTSELQQAIIGELRL